MKRFGPPMIDRRLKRKQTRHEVEREALEEQRYEVRCMVADCQKVCRYSDTPDSTGLCDECLEKKYPEE